MKHPKKIYYVPGLISAIIIPILFWVYGNREFKKPISNVIDLVLSAKSNKKNEAATSGFEHYRNWDYKKIVVKPNTARSNSKYYVSEIKKLQTRNQKETGIEFVITNENSYDDFISILNDCHKSKQEKYGIDLDKSGHFFVLVDYKDDSSVEAEYECLLCNDVVSDVYEPSFFEKNIDELKKLSKEAFYLIFGFLILLNISMLSIKESLQNH